MLTACSPYKIRKPAESDVRLAFDIDRLAFGMPRHGSIEMLEACWSPGAEQLVIEDAAGYVRGHFVFQECESHMKLLRIAIHPMAQGYGMGRAVLRFLLLMLSQDSLPEVWIEVPADNLGAQLWLKRCRVRALESVEDAYGREAIRFVMFFDHLGVGR